jgi:hypothetical protein
VYPACRIANKVEKKKVQIAKLDLQERVKEVRHGWGEYKWCTFSTAAMPVQWAT